MIAVVTDTCASIPDDLAAELDIEVVPYYVHRDGETLRDTIDVTSDEFYRWLPTAQKLPTTANPSPGDYMTAFDRVAGKGATEIVTLHMTSKGSGAYQSACVARDMAKEGMPHLRIETIDTLQVAMVHGYAAVEAARAARRSESFEQVIAAARHVCETGQMYQTSDTLKYLYMGGRIGKAKHLVGTLLNMKPIVSMGRDGIIFAAGSARGWANAREQVLALMAENGAEGNPIKVAITHNAAPEGADLFREMVTDQFDCQEVLMSQLSPALGVHTGPGMIGVHFFPLPQTI
jgi:DegV family protein with EDD domain